MRIPTTSQAYTAKILATGPIAYWPLTEVAGAVANDVSGNARHGSYTGVDLAQPGVINTAPYFDGANDYVNVYSAGLAAAFNGAAGTVMVWARVANVGEWTDGSTRYCVGIEADLNNRVLIAKSTSSNVFIPTYQAGGTRKERSISTSRTDWMAATITWDKNAGASGEVIVYLDGAQQGATLTELGTWVGAPDSTATAVGARYTTLTHPWLGWLGHAALWSRALTPTEVAEVSRL